MKSPILNNRKLSWFQGVHIVVDWKRVINKKSLMACRLVSICSRLVSVNWIRTLPGRKGKVVVSDEQYLDIALSVDYGP